MAQVARFNVVGPFNLQHRGVFRFQNEQNTLLAGGIRFDTIDGYTPPGPGPEFRK
jgi:hypothetical protein